MGRTGNGRSLPRIIAEVRFVKGATADGCGAIDVGGARWTWTMDAEPEFSEEGESTSAVFGVVGGNGDDGTS